MYEPDSEKQYIFDTYEQAMEAYMLLSEEIKEIIAGPRQSHDCWIFDKYEQE
jgi:hypothetical protein